MIRLTFYVKGFPPQETGGPAEVACHLVRELVRSDQVDLTLVVQTDSTEEEIHTAAGAGDRLTVIRLPYYPTLREIPALRRVARAFLAADVVHFNEFPFRHMPLLLVAKLRGRPIVLSLHGLISREIGTFLGPSYPVTIPLGGGELRIPPPRVARRALRAAYRWFSDTWTAIVAPSEALKQEATSQEGFDPSRFVVIAHGAPHRSSSAAEAASSGAAPRVLFVGKLEAIKGPDLLFEALDHLRKDGAEIDVSVVGTGSLEPQLRATAERLGPHRIAFHGLRRGDALDPLFASADIVVIPSRQETLSLVALEAMAAGRPILATRVGGIPEIVHEPRNGLLVAPESDAIAEGLRYLIEHPAVRVGMRKANLADAGSRSWTGVAARYLGLYGKLISDATSSGSASRRARTHHRRPRSTIRQTQSAAGEGLRRS
ncbi:MAG TPA: glycosyltransferase family 4 protein [Thermoplasmata archaeon]|nr:glycosyltransferase family 4 protein [Thermoplasmata archaeon]